MMRRRWWRRVKAEEEDEARHAALASSICPLYLPLSNGRKLSSPSVECTTPDLSSRSKSVSHVNDGLWFTWRGGDG